MPAPGGWVGATEQALGEAFGKPVTVLSNERDNRVHVFVRGRTRYARRSYPQDGVPVRAPGARDPIVRPELADTGIIGYHTRCAVCYEIEGGRVVAWAWSGRWCETIWSAPRPE